MDAYTSSNYQQRVWIPQPDWSGYRPLRRSGLVVDLRLPPRRLSNPVSHNMDPEYCHRTLHEHRQATKQRYRRIIRDQMKAEEASRAYQHQQGLEPFPYSAFEMKQPLLPALSRAMHESGGDAATAWHMFDRRSRQEKAAEEAADEKREAEVQRRADEMIRNEKEAKEDQAMRELLEELPIFKCPEVTNAIPFASVIGNIQERISAHIAEIIISHQNNPHLQLILSQLLTWAQQNYSLENSNNILLISVDELKRYRSVVADRIFHHLSADFKKHDYLRQLRNTQARLRHLKQANSELRAENEKLRSGVQINNNQLERISERTPHVDPSLQRPEYQQPRIHHRHERSTATPFDGLDWTLKYWKNIVEQSDDMFQTDHMVGAHHRDARRASSVAPHYRGRAKVEAPQTPVPELDPVTGYGTVVAVDEISPIYDYPELDRVSMRGGAGNPYSLLEDSESDGCNSSDGKAAHLSNASSIVGKGTLNKMKRYVLDDDDDDDDSFSSLKYTRHSDTQSKDPNNRLWGGEPPSSFEIGASSAVRGVPSGPRNNHNKGRRSRDGATSIAPGLVPFTPKMDPYAEAPRGFQFGLNRAENIPLEKTWTTLDPTTGTVKYEEGAEETREENPQESSMWNPSSAINTPLAATFGSSNVVYATTTTTTAIKETKVLQGGGLTEKSLWKLERQSRQDKAESIDNYIDITSTPGSPNAPPSEPSVIEYRPALPQGSIFTDDTADEHPSRIDADVRMNFMDNISAMHDARHTRNTFEQRNQEGWSSKTKASVSYINEFGDDNIIEVKVKTETRTRKMNDKGQYEGKDLGQVKKRYLRGLSEMIEARDDEMVRATKEYCEWKSLTLEGRMERLKLIRQPVDLWKGKPGADQNDQHELHYLPAVYSRRISRRNEKKRLRAILAEKAKHQDDASTSVGTAGTGDTRDTWGVLGDCDDLLVAATSEGFRTPREGDESLQSMLQRALNIDTFRGSSSRSRSRSRSSSKSATLRDAETRVSHLSKSRPTLYSGGSGTGNSVAGPRPSKPFSVPPSLSPAASPNAWCFGETGSDAASTVRGLRNAPLDRQIFNGSGTRQSSNGTIAADELAALTAAYDDAPALRVPMDTDILPTPLTEGQLQVYSYAIKKMEERGRVVTVRLHVAQESLNTPGDFLPKFTPGTIAKKVFGGVIQEFQLHPDRRTAVVVFVFQREARSFVHHIRNVREKGTEQDIRELQIEASWYRGAESQAILPAQPDLLKHSLTGARRCILISHIPKEKANRVVFQELSAAFNTILVCTSLITPPQNYILESEGKQAFIEFASLQDAIQAYEDLSLGLISGYENSDPQFKSEPEEKGPSAKDYCGCLGCFDKRKAKSNENDAKKRKRDEQMGGDDLSTNYSDSAGG
ncbi:hypothetical protein V492_04872 [Pseudogymnoascus sp. VKM F-4246]|nr:hypothetical protein V492_04872 [Pseudogymnoascus sp. VKM F-4246]